MYLLTIFKFTLLTRTYQQIDFFNFYLHHHVILCNAFSVGVLGLGVLQLVVIHVSTMNTVPVLYIDSGMFNTRIQMNSSYMILKLTTQFECNLGRISFISNFPWIHADCTYWVQNLVPHEIIQPKCDSLLPLFACVGLCACMPRRIIFCLCVLILGD